jgi:hypothetical protein
VETAPDDLRPQDLDKFQARRNDSRGTRTLRFLAPETAGVNHQSARTVVRQVRITNPQRKCLLRPQRSKGDR